LPSGRPWRISPVQMGTAILGLGVAILVAIPSVYATIASSRHSHRAWWWPTWWMLAPLALVVVGVVLVAVERGPSAATGAKAASPASIDPRDWESRCDWGGDLLFVLTHRRENRITVATFSDWRCTVTDPAGGQVEATGRCLRMVGASMVAQWDPAFFPTAPPLRTGTYSYIWSAEDPGGLWHELARGRCEAPYPAQEGDTSPGAPGELEVLVVEEHWRNHGYRALIVDAKVRIHNRSNRTVSLGGRFMEYQATPGPDMPTEHPMITDEDVRAECDAHERARGPWPTSVGPGATVYGWCVMATPNRPAGGTPWYAITVTDEVRHQYRTRRLEQPA